MTATTITTITTTITTINALRPGRPAGALRVALRASFHYNAFTDSIPNNHPQ